tara:strand:- start:694 stop:1182 length:489 start_codon:yes stop_codon:yes gene_type:complete
MQISLDKFLLELNSASPGLLRKIKALYPLKFNIEIGNLPEFSITLNNDIQTFNSFKHSDPQFSLSLNIINVLKNKSIPTNCISGDAEVAAIFLGAISNTNIDLDLLVYKYFGDIPALILRKILSKFIKRGDALDNNNQTNKLLKSFRDISIRVDRLERALTN